MFSAKSLPDKTNKSKQFLPKSKQKCTKQSSPEVPI